VTSTPRMSGWRQAVSGIASTRTPGRRRSDVGDRRRDQESLLVHDSRSPRRDRIVAAVVPWGGSVDPPRGKPRAAGPRPCSSIAPIWRTRAAGNEPTCRRQPRSEHEARYVLSSVISARENSRARVCHSSAESSRGLARIGSRLGISEVSAPGFAMTTTSAGASISPRRARKPRAGAA